ncbi:MAG: histidine phosphatase family protein [Verrucomicrobiia bacterium]|jgi:probable phosphoglycerate mutase
MFENTSITLIRHGETEWNLSGRWQGHADSPLSPCGLSQAKALGERILGEEFDFYFSSDLGRAMHTSKLVGGPSGMIAESNSGFRERDLGVLEGLNTNEMEKSQPGAYKSFRNDGPDFQVPNGESFRQFYDRCANAIEELAQKYRGGRIAVVTHGGVLGAIFRYVLNIPLEAERNFVLLNCSINRIEKKESGWHLISWGDVAHLKDLDSLDDA